MDVEQAIVTRKTEKVLSQKDLPVSDCRETVKQLLAVAGMAPFHRACEERHRSDGKLPAIEPWRFYALDAKACRKLRTLIPLEQAGKIPAMLAAADAMVIATWLPDRVESAAQPVPLDGGTGFAASMNNMEHIAAASAAVQNLLIAATARGISNYWSSGGVLRLPQVFQLLSIPMDEVLLGAIFLFPKEYGDAELALSKLREKRGPADSWSRWIDHLG